MRLVQIKNRAAPSELIPGISIRSIKLISNQLDILVVYIASCIPSERITINLPLNYNKFRRLEAELAEDGREMREKHHEQYERKLAAEEKKKNKDAENGQKSLKDMFKGSGKKGKTKADNSGSDEAP